MINEFIIKRIIRNAAIALGLNLFAVLIAICSGPLAFRIEIIIFWSVLFPPCLLNILLLAGTGAVMAIREERLIRQGKLKRKGKPTRQEKLQQLIYGQDLPQCALTYIDYLATNVRYRYRVRRDVAQELIDHFADELADCQDDNEKNQKAEHLIEQFGDAKLLATLIRRGKKRCQPLWVQGLVRTCQAGVLLMVLFAFYTVWFISGKPNPRIDYLAVINQKQRDIKANMPDENNALLDYKRAEELFIKPGETIVELIEKHRRYPSYEQVQLTDGQKGLVREWLKQNEPAWQALIAGSKKPYYYSEVEYEGDNKERGLSAVAQPIPEFWRHLRSLGFWRMRMEVEQGQVGEALEECILILRVVRHLSENSYWLVEHMVAVLSTRETVNALLYIIKTNKLSAGDLKAFQEQLAGIFPNGYPNLTLCMEQMRMLALDTMQRYFTEGGPGGGHIIPSNLDSLDDEHFNIFFKELKPVAPYILCMLHAGRDETMKKVNEHVDCMVQDIQMSPYQWRVNDSISGAFAIGLSKYRYFFIRRVWPIMRGRADAVFRSKAHYEAAITILALERWSLDKNEYPQSLNELIEGGYLVKLAMDPYSDKPLVYRRTDNGFILYSVGADFDDDGGAGSNRYGWIWGDGDSECDAVFWPVE